MKTYVWMGLIVACCCLDTLAANPVWNKGHVRLQNGQTIEGQLNYNWKAEVLQVRMPDGNLRAFSAHRVDSFCYYDASQNALRKFSSIELPATAELTRPVIMEECTIGHLTVYRRLRHTKEIIKLAKPSLYSNDDELIKDYDNFTYYVVDTNGLVIDLGYFERLLWPQMLIDYRKPLLECLHSRQLDLSSTVGRLILINHYNYLHEHMPVQANKPTVSLTAYE